MFQALGPKQQWIVIKISKVYSTVIAIRITTNPRDYSTELIPNTSANGLGKKKKCKHFWAKVLSVLVNTALLHSMSNSQIIARNNKSISKT